MYITSPFTDGGVPAPGLSPVITIKSVPDGTTIVNAAAMTDIGDGIYYYDFTLYDENKDYAIISDGGASLANSERYQFAGNENFLEDIKTLTDPLTSDSTATIIQIQALQSDVTNIQSDITLMQADLKRTLGLMHENIFIDNPTYDSDGNMDAARVRIYSDPGSVGTDSDVIGSYIITSVTDGPGRFTNWAQTRIS